jgi:hypothetical protein
LGHSKSLPFWIDTWRLLESFLSQSVLWRIPKFLKFRDAYYWIYSPLLKALSQQLAGTWAETA